MRLRRERDLLLSLAGKRGRRGRRNHCEAWRRWWRWRRVGLMTWRKGTIQNDLPIIVPAHPNAFQSAIWQVSKMGKREPDIAKNSSRHVPDESFEVVHPSDREGDECSQHFSALLRDRVLRDPVSGAVAKGELSSKVGIVVSLSTFSSLRVRCDYSMLFVVLDLLDVAALFADVIVRS
jgi:hypothetical protein